MGRDKKVVVTADGLADLAHRVASEARRRERAAFDDRWGEFVKCLGCGARLSPHRRMLCGCGSVSWVATGYAPPPPEGT